jgi:hypothetical protein
MRPGVIITFLLSLVILFLLTGDLLASLVFAALFALLWSIFA